MGCLCGHEKRLPRYYCYEILITDTRQNDDLKDHKTDHINKSDSVGKTWQSITTLKIGPHTHIS